MVEKIINIIEDTTSECDLKCSFGDLRSCQYSSELLSWSEMDSYLEYNREYVRSTSVLFEDISHIIESSIFQIKVISYFVKSESDISPLVRMDFYWSEIDKDRVKVYPVVGKYITALALKFNDIRYEIGLFGDFGISYWPECKALKIFNFIVSFVDLGLPLAEIKAGIRKSYKSLINGAQRSYIVREVHDREKWYEMQSLHQKVAGRVTRSQRSWDLQYEAIIRGNAKCLYVENESSGILGFIFVFHSLLSAYYAVGVYSDKAKNSGIAHLLQFTMIGFLKDLGLDKYVLSVFNDACSTEKEASIHHFKAGFARSVESLVFIKSV